MKTVVAVFLFAFTAAETLAQGTVDFSNYFYLGTNRLVDAPFFDQNGMRLEGPNYVAQLYVWKTSDGFVPVDNPVPFGTNGYFIGSGVTIPFITPHLSAWVQVRAWKINDGATFEEAVLDGGWTGLSEILFVPQTGGGGSPPMVPAPLIGLKYPGSPLIVRQPYSQSVLSGSRAMLSVIASSGVQMAYQWHQNGGDRPDGLIVGATNATYTTAPLTNTTTFWVSVSNSAGSVLSDKATVTVVPAAPHLALEIADGEALLTLGGPAGFTYRIEYNTNLSTTNWTRLVEVSSSTSPFTFSDSGWSNSAARFYRAVVIS